MQAHQFQHQRQADAAPLDRPAHRAGHPVEALEQPGQLIRRNANAGIADAQLHAAVFRLAHRHRNRPGVGELERVGEQVQDDGLPHVAVHRHREAQRRAFHDQLQAGALDGRAEQRGQFSRERGQVGRLGVLLHPAGLDP
ncbi:hypothetical protein D3C72_763330 [compost metagenome]